MNQSSSNFMSNDIQADLKSRIQELEEKLAKTRAKLDYESTLRKVEEKKNKRLQEELKQKNTKGNQLKVEFGVCLKKIDELTQRYQSDMNDVISDFKNQYNMVAQVPEPVNTAATSESTVSLAAPIVTVAKENSTANDVMETGLTGTGGVTGSGKRPLDVDCSENDAKKPKLSQEGEEVEPKQAVDRIVEELPFEIAENPELRHQSPIPRDEDHQVEEQQMTEPEEYHQEYQDVEDRADGIENGNISEHEEDAGQRDELADNTQAVNRVRRHTKRRPLKRNGNGLTDDEKEMGIEILTQDQIVAYSKTWNAEMWLTSAFRRRLATNNRFRNTLRYDVSMFFVELDKKNEEKGCCSMEVIPSQTLPVDGYRGLKTEIDKMVLAYPGMPQNTGNSSSKPLDSITFTGRFLIGEDATGDDIIETVNNATNAGESNGVFEKGPAEFFEKTDAVEMDRKFFVENMPTGAMDNVHALTVPTPIFDANRYSSEELESHSENSSICIIKNLIKKYKIGEDQFDFKTLNKRIEKGSELALRRQIPQSSSTNVFKSTGKKVVRTNHFRTSDTSEKVEYQEFASNYEELMKIADDALTKLTENFDRKDAIMLELKEDLMKKSNSIGQKENDPKVPMLAFGTNIDLVDLKTPQRFEQQMKEIGKLPHFLQPNGEGSLMKYGAGILPGVNMPQIYMKPPGARSSPHQENHLLKSININLGPGSCVWYAIPLEWTKKFHSFIMEQFRLEHRRTGQSFINDPKKVYRTGFWPHEKEIKAAGNPILKFIQEPGSTVLVNVGTYHWVQSNGQCINLSWNMAPSTHLQLSMAAIMNDHYLKMNQPRLLAIEQIVWKMAKEKVVVDEGLHKLIKAFLTRSLAHSQSKLLYLQKKQFNIERNVPDLNPVERCFTCEEIIFQFIVKIEKKDFFSV
uniref:JmjC domain-containing protein n=1 Tax=Caenorhabditis tropicalis TaxID=1561998 RepID=A0A1I7V3H5_9PELO